MRSVVFFSNHLKTLGGKSNVIRSLAKELIQNGYDVKLVSESHIYDNLFIRENNRIRGIIRDRGSIRNIVDSMPASSKWVCCDFESLILCLGIVKRHNIIFWSHSSFSMIRYSFKIYFLQIIQFWIGAIIVLNPTEAKTISRSIVIPNFYKGKELNGQNVIRIRNVVAFGRFSWEKRFDDFILLASKCTDLDLTFHLFGDGPERDRLEALIMELGVGSNFVLHKSTNLDEIMKIAHVLVVTSVYDCFPTNILEAKANSIPVISYDAHTGPRHMIENGVDGFILPIGDIQGVKMRLLTYLKDSHSFLEAGKQSFVSLRRFEVTKIVNEWKRVLSS